MSIYVKENIEYSVREDLCYSNRNIETIFIEIDKMQFCKDRDIVVGVVYRPPDTDIKEFNQIMAESMSLLCGEKKLIYLMGDYNINLLNADKHALTQDFADIMFSHSFIPCITKPTRITNNSATLIDNIFSNNLSENTFTGLLFTDISDHLPIFYLDYTNSVKPLDKPVKRRIYSEENVSRFKLALDRIEWNEVMSLDDAQEAYSHFHKVYTDLYKEHFPLKTLKLGYKNRKPWLSEGLKKKTNKNKKSSISPV